MHKVIFGFCPEEKWKGNVKLPTGAGTLPEKNQLCLEKIAVLQHAHDHQCGCGCDIITSKESHQIKK